MSAPVAGQPAWLPDPTGRHQHRWWDGARFTDRVADDGQASIDPGAVAPGPAPAPAPAGRSRVPLLLTVAGLVLVAGGAAAFVLVRDGSDGTGTFSGTIDGDLGTHGVSLDAGDALLVTLAPGDDLDVVLGALVDEAAADALEETYEDLAYIERRSPSDDLSTGADELDDGLELVLREDLRFAGEPELLLLPVAEAADVTVVVAPFDPDEDADDYEITIDVVALDVDEGADAEDLLEAVADAEDVPADLRELADEVLEGG